MAAQGIADAVQAYTGLSPAAAFTVLALMLATYLIVSTLFVAPDAAASAPAAHPKPPQQQEQGTEAEAEPEPFVPPFPDPVQVGEITLEQLRAYDGKDTAKSILIAIRGQVYDVSRGRVEYIQPLSKHCVLVLLAVSSRCSFTGRASRRLLLHGRMLQPSANVIQASSSRTSCFRMEGEMSCGASPIGARDLRGPALHLPKNMS
ncbi:membrane steroid-binding protein 1 isoform X1 [Triticum aestivum]|uniref:membrane steroid-binding protein 1 isoform X1 n=1 Tax=Triticum aestivum TaxID=4565 RepID=UPI001D0143AF|nr:membrane steroid-binding protein 1-like isoform X1 [Triticum aestivum]